MTDSPLTLDFPAVRGRTVTAFANIIKTYSDKPEILVFSKEEL